MAQDYNILMHRFNGTDYDDLYPAPAEHSSTHSSGGSDALPNNSISTSMIINDAVTEEKIAPNATNTSTTVTLTTAGWGTSTKQQTVNITGMSAVKVCIVSPAPASFVAYGEAQVRATAQGSGTLTFTCEDIPSAELTVIVTMLT